MLSCGDDNESNDLSQIIGSWYGTHSYYNPAGGTKYQYLTVSFDSNGLGSLEYESPVSISFANFTYSVQRNIIKCQGAYANSDGDWGSDFDMSLRIEGDRLIPIDRYTSFILTRDGSVETGGDGDEVIDDSEYIYGVWLHNDGGVVLVLDRTSFTEYTLMSGSTSVYRKKTEGSFSYNYRQNYILINNYQYDIVSLTKNSLQLQSTDTKKLYNYNRGTESDIPNNGEDTTDYRAILELALMWKDDTRSFVFHHSNQIAYYENSSKSYGSWGPISLVATGTYYIYGKNIYCSFSDVSWQDGKSGAKDYFPGWVCGEEVTKVFSIESISTECLWLRHENGKTYYLYPTYLTK